MDSAKFKLIRKILGLSATDIANRLNVQVRSVQRWEQPGRVVPDFAGQWLEDLYELRLEMVASILEQAALMAEDMGEPAGVNLSIYTDQNSLNRAGHDKMTVHEHTALVALTMASLDLDGFSTHVSWVGHEE